MKTSEETSISFSKDRTGHYYACGLTLNEMYSNVVFDLALASPNLEEWQVLKYAFEGIKRFYETRSINVTAESLYKKFNDKKQHLRDTKNRMFNNNG